MLSSEFRPMLATDADLSKLQYPLYASPKLDGLRCMVIDGEARTRSLKPFPNKHVNNVLNHSFMSGFDGELIVGEPTAKDCMQQCTSHLMSKDKVFDFTYHVFDWHDLNVSFEGRYRDLQAHFGTEQNAVFTPHEVKMRMLHSASVQIKLLPQTLIKNEAQLLTFESAQLDLGYEGLILRKPNSPYKFGRSTVKEGYLLKVKRFVDAEAVVIGFVEQMYNGNEAKTNELGRTKRSSAKAGKSGKDTLGALQVRDLKTGVEFEVGTGMNDALRKEIWMNQMKYLGSFVKYKFFPIGVKDKPRHPVFLAFRDPRDMS